MPYNVPQRMMYNMRGRGADGNMVRNRSGEQNFTRSGNPVMPIYNTAPPNPTTMGDPRVSPAGGYQPTRGAVAGGVAPATTNGYGGVGGIPLPQFLGGPGGPYDGTVRGGDAAPAPAPAAAPANSYNTPERIAARNAVLARFAAGGYAKNPASMAAIMPNINYNLPYGQDPFAAQIAAMHQQQPAPLPALNS